jgi:VIT1/CCC1 family predicted Fe2+/Mn2+ transporter
VITTLGLMVGLHSGTHLKLAVIGGILTVAVADAFSDALGIHVSQESQDKFSKKSVWVATFSTLLSKLFFALTFVVPVLFLDLLPAVIISVIWGLLVLGVFSFIIAKRRQNDPWKVVLEHLVIALIVIMIAHFLGEWVANTFGRL